MPRPQRHVDVTGLRGEHTLEGLVGGASVLASLPPTNRTATVRQIVLNRARADGSLLCSNDASEPTFVRRPESGDGMGGFFDRQGRFECEPFAFGAGELVTVLYFNRPLWATHLRVFPQHALIFIFYTPLDGSRAPLDSMVSPHGSLGAGYTVTDLDGTRSLRCAQPPENAPDGAYEDGVVGVPPTPALANEKLEGLGSEQILEALSPETIIAYMIACVNSSSPNSRVI